MEPNVKYIQELMFRSGWSQAELARKLGMSRAEVNRFFNGHRKGGAKLIGGIVRVFSSEPLEKLFFLDEV